MKILGINSSFLTKQNHDTSVALLVDGKLIENLEEERFNRIKHSHQQGFPINSVKYVLSKYNLSLDDLDIIAMPIQENLEEYYIKQLSDILQLPYTKIPKFIYSGHHVAHICDSFFQSGFKSAAALIVDGVGDISDGITLAHVKDNKINVLKVFDIKQSLGLLYAAGTTYLNLNRYGEGKLMGLSSYGIPDQPMPLYWENNEIKYKHLTDDVELLQQEHMHYFHTYFKRNCYPYKIVNPKLENNFLYYINFAASIQNCYNDIFIHLAKYLKELTNEDNLILSGGCIQNCIGNNLLVESKIFKNVFAGPTPHDAGTAAGLAFYAALINNEKIENKRLKNSYTGKIYTDDEILNACKDYKITEYNIENVIQDLKNNKIIAWFQGGSEIGPRALGHRSILANPANRDNLLIINNYIKHRENWRPLAPVVPAELFDIIFEVSSYDLTEFMLRTIKIRDEWQKKLPAICHIDYTTRPQRLEKEQNPELYNLLMEFYKKTGIPCLINTSFNDKNEPIIETPEQAINFINKTDKLSSIIFNAKYQINKKFI